MVCVWWLNHNTFFLMKSYFFCLRNERMNVCALSCQINPTLMLHAFPNIHWAIFFFKQRLLWLSSIENWLIKCLVNQFIIFYRVTEFGFKFENIHSAVILSIFTCEWIMFKMKGIEEFNNHPFCHAFDVKCQKKRDKSKSLRSKSGCRNRL